MADYELNAAQEAQKAQDTPEEGRALEMPEASERQEAQEVIKGQLSIFIDDDIEPKLNPKSPEFDKEAYQAATADLWQEAIQRIQYTMESTQKEIAQKQAHLREAIAKMGNIAIPENVRAISKAAQSLSEYIEAHRAEFEAIQKFSDELNLKDQEGKDPESLLYYIREVLTERKEAITPVEFLEELSPAGVPENEWAADILKEARKRRKQTQPSSRELAKNAGAIMSLAGRVATITGDTFRAWATPERLKTLPPDIKALFDEGTGRLYERSIEGKELQPLEGAQLGFLMAMLQVAYRYLDIREYNSRTNATIPLYLPGFFSDAKIDPRPRTRIKREGDKKKELLTRSEQAELQQRAGKPTELKELRKEKFLEFMRPFVGRIGVIPGEGLFAIANFEQWDEKTEIAYISIPYELKIIEMAKLNNQPISHIFNADIVAEPKAAVELANRIAVGVIERGVTKRDDETYKSQRKPRKETIKTKDKDGNPVTVVKEYDPPKEPETEKAEPQERRITWACKFATLIKDCPQLQAEINQTRTEVRKEEAAAIEAGKTPEEIRKARAIDHKTDPQRINKKLKDNFDAAIRIIREKSKMPEYYLDFKIKTGRLNEYKAPTNSTLKEKLIISYKGKNPNYKE